LINLKIDSATFEIGGEIAPPPWLTGGGTIFKVGGAQAHVKKKL